MVDRPILGLHNPRRVRRLTRSQAWVPRPEGAPHDQQANRFNQEFDRLEAALVRPDAEIELRRDPFGIAPERALVFVTAAPINNFARAAQRVNLGVYLEFELGNDYELPDGLISKDQKGVNPTLYATMPTLDSLRKLLRLWRRYEKGNDPEYGYTPWWDLFDLLAKLRPWGPEDRLTPESRRELEDRLPIDDDDEVRIELEHWPYESASSPEQWRRFSEVRIEEIGGRIIDRSSIHEGSFHYEALLVGLSASQVREMISDPSAPDGLATLEGIQFILPQTIAQSLPSQSSPVDVDINNLERFEKDGAFRALLLDGTPIARHPILDGGIVIEDTHDLVGQSVVSARRHATEMASLILRGDLMSDGQPLVGSRVLAIPLLIDSDRDSTAPDDQLFIDLVHVALQRAFEGDAPLAPDVFVVNFSIGVLGGHFTGRISSLARLLDWWSYKAGVLFVVSAGNIQGDLEISNTNSIEFEGFSVSKRQDLVRTAQQFQRHKRTLLFPSEALNALTIGAASLDPVPSVKNPTPGTVEMSEDGEILPAISTAIGLGPFRCIKPDLIAIGGRHEIQHLPGGDVLRLRVVQETNRTGLTVAGIAQGIPSYSRSRGTSCAAAIVTRSLVNAAAALTEKGGPYEGHKLSRTDLALLTRALAVNGARLPETAELFYQSERNRLQRRYRQAQEEVARYYGHGYLNPGLMLEAPLNGATLVGLGRVQKDGGTVFNLPLPSSLSGDKVKRSMLVTLAWFSPVEPTRARYRLAALEAVAADGDMQEDEKKDDEWGLGMKSAPPTEALISRGTVWSRRFVHRRQKVSGYSDDATLPIRIQCRDASGGGLDPDVQIHFAMVVTLQLETPVLYDILEEIRDRLLIRVQAQGQA